MSAPLRMHNGDNWARVDGMNWRGPWVNQDYDKHDVVTHLENWWVANTATNEQPFFSSDWDAVGATTNRRITHGTGAPPQTFMKENDLHVEYGPSTNPVLPDTEWTDLVLLNGWEPYGSTWGAARYRRINGVVYLNIMVRYGTVTANIATLPAGFLPMNTLIYVGYQSSSNDPVRFNVYSTGTILLTNPDATSTGFFSVQAAFPADQ